MSQTQLVGGHKTTVSRKPNGELSIVYHSTEVVHVAPNGDITLNTGGWRSNTTKLRMNQAANQYNLGFRVYQQDHRWFVTTHHDNYSVPVEFWNSTFIILSGKAAQ